MRIGCIGRKLYNLTRLASWRDAVFALVLFVPVLIGNHFGSLAFGKVSDPVWRGFVGLLLGVSGLMAVVRLLG
jgi:hypothetical protein